MCSMILLSCRSPRAVSMVQDLMNGNVSGVHKRRQPPEAEGVGPLKALKRLGLDSMAPLQRSQWAEEARLCAVLGTMQFSMDSWKSGVRCYVAFVGEHACVCACLCVRTIQSAFADACHPETKMYFPPKANLLVAWAMLFQNVNTLRNYLGFVKTGCLVVGPRQQCVLDCPCSCVLRVVALTGVSRTDRGQSRRHSGKIRVVQA